MMNRLIVIKSEVIKALNIFNKKSNVILGIYNLTINISNLLSTL